MASTKKPGDQAKTTKPGTGTPAKPGSAASKPGTGTPSRPSAPPVLGDGTPSRPSAPVKTTTPAPAAAPAATQKSNQAPVFTLTQAQKDQLKNMPADAAERQIAIWREQWRIAEARKASYVVGPQVPTTTTTSTRTTTPSSTSTSQTGVVTTQTMPTQPAVPVNWEDAAKELYGGYYSIIQSTPELQDLLRKAIENEWGDGRFQYELRQTSWWKSNSSTAREWDLASQIDPATAQQQITNRVSELQNIALSEYQVDLSDAQLRKLATDSIRFGWSQQMLMNAIGLEATRTTGGMSDLSSGFIGQGLRQTANNYGVVLSDDTFNKWVTDIATGKETRETFQQYALNTAKTMFPAITSQLDAGLTFQQIVDPYRNVAAQTLEISPNSINFLDPKWTKAISLVDGNQQRMMNFNEWGDYLRQERSFGYEYTSQAQTRAYQVANELAGLFGKV